MTGFEGNVKCTYGKCAGSSEGGIVDKKLRPWHMKCASLALVELEDQASWWAVATIISSALFIVVAGNLFSLFLLR